MNDALNQRIIFAARIIISLMFIESFADKLLHWDFYMAELQNKAIPLPALALGAAVITELLGSVALVTGFGLCYAALALAGYTIVVTFIYFDFWNQLDSAAVMARKEFLKNFAVAGGLMLLVALRKRSNHV